MRDAEINDVITKLYKKVNTYSAEDWWYFDVLLAIHFCKPLQLRRWWIVNARILANKSDDPVILHSLVFHRSFMAKPFLITVFLYHHCPQ
jgi:hypothetical protein